MTDDGAGPYSRGGWRVLLPVSLLVCVACAQVTLATTAGLTAWTGPANPEAIRFRSTSCPISPG